MISYLQGGETPTSEQWNVIFSALDNKIAKALGNRSLLTIDGIQHAFSNWFGPKVFFLGAENKVFTTSVFGADAVGYDHSEYEDYADGEVLEYNTAKRLVHIADTSGSSGDGISPLDTSLAVHTKALDVSWIPADEWPDGVEEFYIVINQRPEHSWPLVQVEVIFEGMSGDELDFIFQDDYNKFNVFRFHNLNDDTLTITFEDKPTVSIEIPARQSRCIRRTESGGDYTEGYRYLQKMVDNDPRFFVYGASGLFGDTPAAIPGELNPCAANNAANPFVIYDLITKVFCGLQDDNPSIQNKFPRFIFDPHTVWDAFELYSSLYGDPAEGNTKLGDLLHHKGKLVVVKKNTDTGEVDQREVEFKGYDSVVADLADGGIHVEHNYDDGTIELSDPDEASNDWAIVGTKGTNLLSRAGEVIPAVDLHADDYSGPVGEAMYRKVYAVTPMQATNREHEFKPLDTVDDSDQKKISSVANKYTDPEVDCSGDEPSITYSDDTDQKSSEDPLEVEVADGDPSDQMRLYSTRVTDVISLKYWGDADYDGADQDTDIIAHEDRQIVFTGNGPRFLCKAVIQPHKLGVWDASQAYSVPHWLMDGNEDGIFLHETVTIDENDKFEIHRHMDFPTYGFPYADGTNCPQPLPSVDHNKRLPIFNVGDDLSANGYGMTWWRASSFVPPRVSRRYCGLDHITYSPTSGLYIFKHPAFDEEMNTDDTWIPNNGKGFSYELKSISGDEEDIKVITPVQYCAAAIGDVTLIRTGARSQFSMIVNPDVLYWWHANRTKEDFYTDTHRDKLLQNEIMPYNDDAWKGSLDSSIRRMLYLPLCIEHYNNMAQLVNSVKSYVPYFENFYRYINDAGELKQLTFTGPPDGIFNGSGPYPRAALFTVASDDSETMTKLEELGIELKTIDDLPVWTEISTTKSKVGTATFLLDCTFQDALEIGDANYDEICGTTGTLTVNDLNFVVCAPGYASGGGLYTAHMPTTLVVNDASSVTIKLYYQITDPDPASLTIGPGTRGSGSYVSSSSFTLAALRNALNAGHEAYFISLGDYPIEVIYNGIPSYARFTQTNSLHGTFSATLESVEVSSTESYTLLSRLAGQYGCAVPTEYYWVDTTDYLAAATRLGYNASVTRFGQGVWFEPFDIDWEQLHPGYTFNGKFDENLSYHDNVGLVTESTASLPTCTCGVEQNEETMDLGAETDPSEHVMIQNGYGGEMTIVNLPMNMLAVTPANDDTFEWCVDIEDNSTDEETYAKIISKITIGDYYLIGSSFTVTDGLVGQDSETCGSGHPMRTWVYSFDEFFTQEGVYGGCTLPPHVVLRMVVDDKYEHVQRAVDNRYTWQDDNTLLDTGSPNHTIADGVIGSSMLSILRNNDTLPLRYYCNAFLDYYSTVEVDDMRAVYVPRILIDNGTEFYSSESPVKSYARALLSDWTRARVPSTVTESTDEAEIIELEHPDATKWTIFAEPADGKAFKVLFYKKYRMLAKQQTTNLDDTEIRVTLEADDADYGDGDELTGCPTDMTFKVEALS